jgi:hypothetical protein
MAVAGAVNKRILVGTHARDDPSWPKLAQLGSV